jgi:hypothetical protein
VKRALGGGVLPLVSVGMPGFAVKFGIWQAKTASERIMKIIKNRFGAFIHSPYDLEQL